MDYALVGLELTRWGACVCAWRACALTPWLVSQRTLVPVVECVLYRMCSLLVD